MASWRSIHDFVVGAAGPADMVVANEADGVRLRLPNQRHRRDVASFIFVAALLIGGFLIASAIEACVKAAEDGRELHGIGFMIGVPVAVLLVIAYKWRVVWHYEIFLTSWSLRVDYFTTFWRRHRTTVDLEPVRQLTIVRINEDCELHAETLNGRPLPFFKCQEFERLQRLATLLAEQHALLTPGRPPLRVRVERPHTATDADRVEPPLNAQVGLTQPGSGLTLDFPLPEDDRPRSRRQAWRAFEIGIVVLVGAICWFAACRMADWPSLLNVAYILFGVGIAVLIAAADRGRAAWYQDHQDDDLRQLAIVRNMLIRTARDYRKQAWYRAEIRTILAAVETSYASSEGGATSVSHYLYLVLELNNGEKVKLLGKPYEPHADYRPKAEFEWIATRLRQALMADAEDPADPTGMAASLQAITEIPGWIKESGGELHARR